MLNHYYQLDHRSDGFEWIDVNNADQQIFSFIRHGIEKGDHLVIICNFSPDCYHHYKVGVILVTSYEEIWNSDEERFGGSHQVNPHPLTVHEGAYHGREGYVEMTIPPYAAVYLKPIEMKGEKLAMAKGRCVAMLLAGGKGSRLSSLTKSLAKPAVPFGGKYRIIDFTLSNCTNSGIDTVGVLTQYQPLVLNSYIGIGSAWDLDRKNGGVTVLPPYAESSEMRWYTGTASAIFQNMNYLEQYDPEYVLILSGDHIYKMDYSKMLDYHIEKKADVTISVIEVGWDEASRFGLMNTE